MDDIQSLVEKALGHAIPEPVADGDLESQVQAAVAASGRKLVALDDDPTGVQTVHDVPVLAHWDEATLTEELRRPRSLFFILTNSRSLPEQVAADLNREIAANLKAASQVSGADFVIASRSDSTLRGHFPAETDAIAGVLGKFDGVLICPAFFEGGRVTVDDVHFIRDADQLIPVVDTEFARDTTFGYRSRTMAEWVEEKSEGRVPAELVDSLSLETIRQGGVEAVTAQLQRVRDGSAVIVNAVTYADLWIVALGVIAAEEAGRRFIYRCGASFVRARAGISAAPLLTASDMLEGTHGRGEGGLVVVGSHVRRTGEQLAMLLELPGTTGIEVNVRSVLSDAGTRAAELARVSKLVNDILSSGEIAAVYTSRDVARPAHLDELTVARRVSDALVEVVRNIGHRPEFIVGKGGITSSDIGTRGLDVRRAMVLGQVRPGVPVWRLGKEGRFPGLAYVVFPGNVGGPETLAEIVAELAEEAGKNGKT